jgi:hypothetical protein
MHSEYKGSACTCTNLKCRESAHTCSSIKCRESAHAPNAQLWTQKVVHTSEQCINDSGRPPTHFWFSSQVDLTPKSELNLRGGLVKYLKSPLFTLKTGWIMPQRFAIKRGYGCTIFSRIYLYCYAASILLQGTSFLVGAYKHHFIGLFTSPLE